MSDSSDSDGGSVGSSGSQFRYRAIYVTGVVAGVGLLAVVLAGAFVAAIEVVCVIAAGVLFGLILARLAGLLKGLIPIPHLARLGIVLLVIALLSGGFLAYFGVQIKARVEKAVRQLDKIEAKLGDLVSSSSILQTAVRATPWSEQLLPKEVSTASSESNGSESNPSNDREAKRQQSNSTGMGSFPSGKLAGMVGKIFSSTLGLLTDLYVVFFVALFVAAEPTSYRKGLLSLFPPAARPRTGEVLNQVDDALWHWFLGRLGAMLVTGVLTSIGMALIGVPFPVVLGVITGIMVFVPNIGGVIAGGLAFLFGLTAGPTTALMVLPLYLSVQLVESNIITPLIQRQQIDAPPAILISSQVLMGVVFGTWGVLVASPLLAALLVIHKTVYRHDILGEEVEPDDEEGDTE